MQTTHTSVLARRVWIESDFHTQPYEAGWAREAVVFTQVEGEHPDLTITTEISPDGITWLPKGEPQVIAASERIAATALTVFGTWIRVSITGATERQRARVLVHLSLKG
jgi:hypothetical protein